VEPVPPWQTSTTRIPLGNDGHRRTLAAMSELAQAGSRDPVVIAAAQNAVRYAPEHSDLADFGALLIDVRRRMRYTPDPLDAEVVKHPRFLIEQSNRHGKEAMDCDDVSVLLAAMLGAIGYRARFVTVGTDSRKPGEWTHVYVSAQRKNGQWVPLDPIVRSWGVGQEVQSSELVTKRDRHKGVTPMIGGMGRIGAADDDLATLRANAVAAGGLPQDVAFPTGGTTSSAGGKAWYEKGAELLSPVAAAYFASKSKPANIRVNNLSLGTKKPAQGGFFTNPDGTTSWGKVALTGGVVVGGAFLLAKLLKR